MLSQVAGAASSGGTPMEAAAAPSTEDETPPPTADVQPFVTSGPPSNRKIGSDPSTSRNAISQDFQFFFEDEVFRIDRKGRVRFGVVTGTAESYSSEDEEEEINEVLGKGEVRCAFYPDGKQIVRNEKSIGLADRTLMPGDVVRRRLPGQTHLSGQAGYVRDVSIRADVKVLGTKYVIKNIPSERLRPITEWSRDVPVCLGNWIGYTVNVNESAVLKSNYGSLLEITSNDFHKFKDAYGPTDRQVFSPNIFYPKSVVIGRLPSLDRVVNLTPNIPLYSNRRRRYMYTVDSVKTASVTVAWTFKATPQYDTGMDTDPLKEPKSCLKGEDLANVKRLNIYESYVLQIHDRFYLKYLQCDKLVKLSTWEEEQDKLFKTIYERQKSDGYKQTDDKEQPKTSSADIVQENLASPSAASSSRNTHMFKLRRLNSKASSLRSRSQIENEGNNLSPKANTSANIGAKKTRVNKDDLCETLDEDADCEEVDELPQGALTSKLLELAEKSNEADNMKKSLSAYASQAARLITRNFKRRNSKKRSRPCKKTCIPRSECDPKDGDELVVETLVVYSTMTVVWQDGTVETGIPSIELYPIHHLDNHEFFPGDFVSKANDYSPTQSDYGVIQSVDHDERIAKVKWFNIYGNMDNPVPSCKEMEELSVYDLKDHADYQYRPGTMVIRVSNFTGDDLNSTIGQVIDNFPDGRVRVWWAKGHITMCYPQDLFELHQSDTQDVYDSEDSENSWETQSDNSQTYNTRPKSRSLNKEELIIDGIDRALQAIDRLEKIFHMNPVNKNPGVIHEILAIYTNCRSLDDFLNTDFFHEDYFHGILDCKVGQKGTKATQCTCLKPIKCIVNKIKETACKHKINVDAPVCTTDANLTNTDVPQTTADTLQTDAEHLATGGISPHLTNSAIPATGAQTASTSTPNKRKSSTLVEEVQCKKTSSSDGINIEEESGQSPLLNNASKNELHVTYDEMISKFRIEFADVLKNARAAFAKAFESHKNDKSDSGIFSRGENSSNDLTVVCDSKEGTEDGTNPLTKSESKPSIQLVADPTADVCEVFFFLLKEQITKWREETVQVFKFKDKESDEQAASDFEVDVEEDDTEALEEEMQDQIMEQPLNLNTLSESLPPLESPRACSSPSPMQVIRSISNKCFEVVSNAPLAHHFIGNIIHPNNKSQYQRAVQREYAMLYASLPSGVVVRAYEDRMDLISVMMVGPKRTPYQNALFFFDFQMGSDYPKSPPTCHYISFCTERLNPNLYEEGKVCVSLLGTWTGRDNEVWTPKSTMLQVLVSIQGLILVDEPYYNEAGYEKQRGTQLGNENSRVYNEMAIIKIVHSTVKQLQNPPLIFRKELIEHFTEFGNELHERMLAWSEYSAEAQRLKIASINDMPKDYKSPCEMPEFPLLPCSRGFCIAVRGVLATLQNELISLRKKQENVPTVTVMATAPRAAPEDV